MTTWHDLSGGGPRRTLVNKGAVPCSIGFQDEQGHLHVLARLEPGASMLCDDEFMAWTDEEGMATELLVHEHFCPEQAL